MNLTKPELSNQPQAIQYFIEKMDIEMVDAFLDDDKTYQGFEKYLFISKLQTAFEAFVNVGNTQLIAFEGNCNGCDKTKRGFTFVGNNTNHYMNLIFDTENNKINDLYECREFKNIKTKLKLGERIYISDEIRFNF